jgi:hypothetical protein
MNKKDLLTGSPGKRKKPPLEEGQRKQPRNLSISNDAWFGLTRKIDALGISSISELNEKIGLSEIRLIVPKGDYNSDLSETTMYARLKQFVQKPVAVFLSTLSFAKRTARQLNLSTSEDLLVDVIYRSFAIIFAHGYLYPDGVYINNPSAVVRCLVYHLLVAEADLKSLDRKKPKKEVEETEQKECLYRIFYALKGLEKSHWASHYQIFKLKAIEGLTIQQIVSISKLQREELSEGEIRQKIKDGLAFFRLFWQETGDYKTKGDINLEKITDDLKNVANIDTIRDYCQLAGESLLSKPEFREKIQNTLIKSIHDSRLDFWINEIDYHLLNRECDSEDFQICQQEYEYLSTKIETGIDEYLLERKRAIDIGLAWCSKKKCIDNVFEEELKELAKNAYKKIDYWNVVTEKPSSETLADELKRVYKELEEARGLSCEDMKDALDNLGKNVRTSLKSIKFNPSSSEQ